MKEKKSNLKTGITLVALVITIVIMLILAAVTIGAINGGLFEYAGKSKSETDKTEEREILSQIYLLAKGSSKSGKIVEPDVKKQTEKYENINEITSIGDSFVIEFTNGKEYILDQDGNIKEKEGLLAYEIAAKDYGNYVFNYSDIDIKDGGTSQLADWQVFYAGKVSNETEDHIYLIASNLVKKDNLPLSNKGNSLGEGTNDYTAALELIWDYSNGSDDVSKETRYLNYGYYDYLSKKSQINNSGNIKLVAYMCDTSVWNKFKTDKADFVIGGPTLELLFKSYNQKYNKNYLAGSIANTETATDSNGNEIITVNEVGYKFSINNGETWSSVGGTDTIIRDTTYRIYEASFWLSSPTQSAFFDFYIRGGNGYITSDGISSKSYGFRPIVRLKANTELEKVEGGYRIIE